MTTFIGIDLAWRSAKNPSGATVLRGDRSGAELMRTAEPLRGNEAVLAFVRNHATEHTVIAIDAPLIIANVGRQRRCETLVGNRYGARDASCHTSNLTLYPNAASVLLAIDLAEDGFRHAPLSSGARVMLEVYPHAALVELFALEKIIKYKKGTAAAKRAGLRRLQGKVAELAGADPPLLPTPTFQSFISTDVENLAGQRLKDYEDAIDSLICAYLAYHYWRWNSARTEIFGDVETGYILNPSMPLMLPRPR
jgi:predicted RNase H-like nuclease